MNQNPEPKGFSFDVTAIPSDDPLADTQPTRTLKPVPSDEDAYYGPPPARGCRLLIALVSLTVAFGLVIVGLFLPPFNLFDRLVGVTYIPLTSAGEAVIHEGLTFAAAASPGDDFGVDLSSVAMETFQLATINDSDWMPILRNAIPGHLALQSPLYRVATQGDPPPVITLDIALSGNAINPDLLDLYGWFENRRRWEFLPSRLIASADALQSTLTRVPDAVAVFQAAPPEPVVLAAHDVTQVLADEVGEVASIIAPGGLQPTANGTITGSLAPGFELNASYDVMPALRNYLDPSAVDTLTVPALLSDPALRTEHIRQIVLLLNSGSYEGIVIDYRELPAEFRDAYSAFIRDLGIRMDAINRELVVVIPAAQNIAGTWETGAYDWRIIGRYADHVQINLGLNPQLYQPGENQFVEAMLRWTVREISREKVLLGLSARSVRSLGGDYTAIGYDAALAGLGDVVVEADAITEAGTIEPGSEIRATLDGRDALAGVETLINAPYIDYLAPDGTPTTRIWLTTPDALRYRMEWTIPFALGGVAFNDLMRADLAEGVLNTIASYREQLPAAPAPTDLALQWRIEGSSGVVDTLTTGLNEGITVTLAAPDGNYAVNVAVVGVGDDQAEAIEKTRRGGAAVALFEPTPTPTPRPTATPTPIPTATPTPRPIVPTNPAPGNNAPASNNFGATRPGAGSIAAGPFELGGHVTSTGSQRAVNAMRRAGMTWMKVQIRYYAGSGAGDAIRAVQQGQANGFKVLVGTVGDPNQLRDGGEGYLNSYAAWLGQIAAAGADAIEVWNEPNIDREWPRDQISGAAYTDMLRRGYQAIKRANPSTMVISGAPAPTGAEAAFPGQVVNDDRFLRQMMDAGAIQYMDCVGIHYNEGTVPPTVTSGDFRDNYYTRYLPTLTNLYWNITGGQRPLCFTELGYLTSAGYGQLPAAFGWASGNTLEQQAAWLAQAAAWLSQTGRVRMMIVWNVDFTLYGSDPQAGFAMVRPDGRCPACDALAGAR